MNDLSVRFAALAPEPSRGDWDDVLRSAGAGRSSHRRMVAFAFAAALILALATAAAVPAVRDFFFEEGLVGLPPEGAEPTVPQRTTLAFSYWVDAPPHMPAPDPWRGRLGRSRVWVYADGTLLWLREVDRGPSAGGIDPWATGFLEQRLTPEGVELLRSELAAAERLELDNGPDRTVLPPYRNTPQRDDVAERLRARLSNPDSWLPPSAWRDKDAEPYVPSRYAICFGANRNEQIEPERTIGLLPEDARTLLRGRGFHSGQDITWPCVDVTTAEARSLAAALDAGGLDGDGVRLTYVVPLGGAAWRKAFIAFEPYLPDGTITCSACG